jgi:sigma-B regulation protein RsbU (phosphoserine phosphatase)
VQAALLSTTLSRWLSAAPTALKENPVAMLEHLNQQFQLDSETSQFFTCCYGVLDRESKSIEFASAGHPCPILLRANRVIEISCTGFPVGVVATPGYESKVVSLEADDRLYIFSDGAVEQPGASGSLFGVGRLKEELLGNANVSLQTSIDLSLGTVLNYTADGKTGDDISMLGIEVADG